MAYSYSLCWRRKDAVKSYDPVSLRHQRHLVCIKVYFGIMTVNIIKNGSDNQRQMHNLFSHSIVTMITALKANYNWV